MSAATLLDLGSLLMRSAETDLANLQIRHFQGKWRVYLTFDDGSCWATSDEKLETACNRAAEYIMRR